MSLRNFGRSTVFVCFAVFACPAIGQVTNVTNETSTPVPGVGHNYIQMLNETVNPANGSVSVRIQIPTPAGRKISLPFAFAYDSNGAEHLSSDGVGGLFRKDNTAYLAKGGWAYSVPAISTVQVKETTPGYGGPGTRCVYYDDYVFQDATGGRHALFLSMVPGPSPECAYAQPIVPVAQLFGGDDYFSAALTTTTAPLFVANADGTVYTFPALGRTHFVPNNSAFGSSLPSSIEDRNGNQITIIDLGARGGANGAFTVTDTLGRTLISSSGFGSSGNSVGVSGLAIPYTVFWGTTGTGTQAVGSVLLWSDASGCNNVPALAGGASAITQITLANNASYVFSYDPNYGLLDKITYPSGGYVSYTWGLNPLSEFASFEDIGGAGQNSCLYHYDSPAVTHRYVSFDGVHTALQQDFSYSTTWSGNPSNWTTKTTTVTTTDLVTGLISTVVYSYSPFTVQDQPNDETYFAPQFPLEQSIVYKNSAGTTLRTVNKTWYDQFELQSQQTTLENGQTSQETYAYGPGAQITSQSDYDFGGGLLRKTITNYEGFNATPIYPGGPSIFDRPCQTVVYDGTGTNRVAETDYFYDGSATTNPCSVGNPQALSGIGVYTGHDESNYGTGSIAPRGNLTAVTRKCLQSCSDAATTYTLDETGQVLTTTDSKGNTTQYSYADSYTTGTPPGNTNAYLTKITRPTTNGVAHVQQFSYGYADGQLTRTKNENNQITSYQYSDSLGRLTETDYPDSGKTTIGYNDTPPSPSITTSRLITSTLAVTNIAVMDGLWHVVQNQIATDPDGTDYTDFTYEGSGRVWKQSNPHRSSALSTDGTTTSYSDALGRICLVVPPDGTFPSGNPCASQPSNTVFTSYSGNTAIVTDQAGNSRKSITDGLGRLVEVDEPGAGGASPVAGSGSASVNGIEQSKGGTPTTPGTGSVTFNGTIQSKQVQTQTAAAGNGSITFNGTLQSKQVQTQAATSGVGTVSIGGIEQSVCPPAPQQCSPLTKIWDSGTVSITVNGFTETVSYAKGSTKSSIASALVGAINGPSAPVTASSSTNLITLTAKSTGASTNYSLSTSVTYDDADFAVPSFTATRSGPTLTGGHDASYTTVNDSGSCTITVNSHGDSTSWSGSGTTTSSIALALASSINGDGGASVNAGASGGIVNVTAKTTGAGTNYTLSSSCSYDSSNFSGPSFTTSNSGSSLTGGRNAAYTTVYDSGTSTISVNGHNNTVSWSGSGTTASSIASALATNINGDSGAFINASASGNGINLTARTTGVGTNYSLASSSTYDSGNFTSPSFSSSNSGANLTGGTNVGATTYDSGTVWIKVAGFQAAVNYGQNDTPTSVVTALANALNAAGSPVAASSSGTTVNFSARAAGANTNFTLTGGSSTNQPGSFSQPSFNISLSGAALTGGSSPTLSLSTRAITTYNYDTLDNLISLTQSGARQRSFSYDSLSRLVCASNPENSSAACPATAGSYTPGTIGYAYDSNGNLATTTAPAPNHPGTATVTTTYSYDALNRLTQKSYSDGTATLKYGYDGIAPSGCTLPSLTIDNGIGKPTGMCDAAGSEAWSYDIVSGTGWKTTDARTTSGVTLTAVAQNNLDGSINNIAYPSGRVVSYGAGGAGRPLSATDGTGNISYASNAQYWPSGSLAALSNGGSISFTSILNSRLQPCWIYGTTGTALPWNSTTACNATAATGNILDLKYNFNLGSADNGNVVGITNNRDTTRSQTFAYDPLNRLITAQTTSTYSASAAHCFGESFGYDAWGNLLSVSESSSSYDGCTYEQPQGWTITAKNQIQSTATCFDGSGNLLTVATYCYDAAGNLLTDTAKSYSYNAENQLKSIPMLGISYLYDGDGRRVAKLNSSGQATKLYWYGTSSDPLDETDGTGATNNSSFFEYAFFNGRRIARRDASNNITYYFGDHLGSSRVLTNASGAICGDADFYPFGGERPITSCNGNNYKFTGKERDAESGLDDFGARYDSSSMGRFMSPDWSAKAEPVPYAKLDNPQSLNLYAYVLNNPLNLTDPDGHEVDLGNKDEKLREEAERRILQNVQKNERGLFTTVTDKNGKTKLVLDKDKAAAFEGTHSKGFNMLTQAINAEPIATVVIDNEENHTLLNPKTGDSMVHLNINGDTSPSLPLVGLDMRTPIPNPASIIAGHELLGHARRGMLGLPHTEPYAVEDENKLRKEQNLPLRGPTYCDASGCYY